MTSHPHRIPHLLSGSALLVCLTFGAPGGSAQAANPCQLRNPCAAANPCQPPNPCNPCARANPCQPPNPCAATAPPPPDVGELVDEFMTTADVIEDQPGGDAAVVFPGPANQPSFYQALVFAREENPLLTRQCKEEALSLSVDTLSSATAAEDDHAALVAAAEHMREHQDFVREHDVSYAAYLRSVAECQSFCAPLVAKLLRCHVLSVARLPHGLVTFDLDSHDLGPARGLDVLLDASDRLALEPDEKLLLIGRASRIGDLAYNRRLSALRTLAVRDRLLELGVPDDRIELMWFGWEPPQVSEGIAREYALGDRWDEEGAQRMNQSVVVVVYPRARAEPL